MVVKELILVHNWAKENYYDRLNKMGITIHTIVGNHTAYYKNTNEIIDDLIKV